MAYGSREKFYVRTRDFFSFYLDYGGPHSRRLDRVGHKLRAPLWLGFYGCSAVRPVSVSWNSPFDVKVYSHDAFFQRKTV